MKSGRISQTALKVGLVMITLNEKTGWKTRLPEGVNRKQSSDEKEEKNRMEFRHDQPSARVNDSHAMSAKLGVVMDIIIDAETDSIFAILSACTR